MKIIERNFLNLITCVIAVSFFTVSCTAGKSFCQSPKNTSAVIQSKPLYSKQDQGKGVFRQSESKLTNKTDYDRPLRRLQCEVRRLAALAGGTVGLSALHIESGQHFSFNGGERFPMASVYKIPIAVQLLSRVDRGKVSLNQGTAGVDASDQRQYSQRRTAEACRRSGSCHFLHEKPWH
jgi:beta-lactamase class A